ncbi:MAG: phosphoribosylformylglycinamidine synthase [Clostridia bacterium]|nr:phosphoribosylformylglycinamidine synthase [Clostridia bacterium]
MAVYRIFVEKKPDYAVEADGLLGAIREQLLISTVTGVRILNRYDVEGIDEELFEQCRPIVFSEPPVDMTYDEMPAMDGAVFAVEYLPGQFDQRADSCAQCIQMVSQGDRPTVRSARVYAIAGNVTADQLAAIKKHVINPVESREASLEKPATLQMRYDIPTEVATLTGFIQMDAAQLAAFVRQYGLAMDEGDVAFCQAYFRSERRDPTLTEIRMIDTYWSDHCRHTTFLTTIDEATFDDPIVKDAYDDYLAARAELGRTKPVNLMDIATIGARYLKAKGLLDKLDESEEINACTVKVTVDVDGEDQDWLFLFKNETHNHPTEIEPFGGAATCIGGAIRDPLSGRSYVYQAMRVTGAADPLLPVAETMPGKLPQRTIVTTAAAGYSSYGNQIGLATGQVDEIYHPGYVAKRMEIGAVVGAAPEANVRREVPQEGDIVVLLGGRTGRDGCGGATGSSKSHTASSLETCGAEVQKGNAPEERKLQRLFRDPRATRLIKRCNDFGAGGVSVAIGELADGLLIDLNALPKKYEGLDGTELAISESQERMAVVLAPKDVDAFVALAKEENLEATVVARVTKAPRLVMTWNGKAIVDISREFLNSNGAEKHIKAHVAAGAPIARRVSGTFAANAMALSRDLNVCSKRGLSERFDSTIGAATVLMPFGGKYQMTPAQMMAAKLPVQGGETKTCSAMAYGYNPFITEKDPFVGAYLAVIESVSKLVAGGTGLENAYLTFQEYFERLGNDPSRWGKPLAALLGALKAQLELGLASIGGKDSMSGSFDKIDVPPTLVSFAVSVCKTETVQSCEFKGAGHTVCLLEPDYLEDGRPEPASLKAVFDAVTRLIAAGSAIAVATPTYGGVAEALLKMTLGNRIGLKLEETVDLATLFGYRYGSFVIELAPGVSPVGTVLGTTMNDYAITRGQETVNMTVWQAAYEGKLEPVYPCNIDYDKTPVPPFTYAAAVRTFPAVKEAKPRVLIPVFPGTNCEYDTARAFERAGAEPDILVVRNLSAADVAAAVDAMAAAIQKSRIIAIPGGFSGGDEPDGSGKFITAFFRNPAIKDAVHELLFARDGLMCGICNGFQALIKLGLVPYGEIVECTENSPTLTFNRIGRHQSRLVRTRVASNKSPWLMLSDPGELHTVAISHGEGRFVATPEELQALSANGQIATQYVDDKGVPTMDIRYNPNGSLCAVEGITSPDGRVFGKMGHSERFSAGVYKNVPGEIDNRMFESAVIYYK